MSPLNFNYYDAIERQRLFYEQRDRYYAEKLQAHQAAVVREREETSVQRLEKGRLNLYYNKTLGLNLDVYV